MDQHPPTEKDGLVISLVFTSLGYVYAMKVICNKPIRMISQLISPALSLSEALAKVRRPPSPTAKEAAHLILVQAIGCSWLIKVVGGYRNVILELKLWKCLHKLTNLVQIDRAAT